MERPINLKQEERTRWVIAIAIGVFGLLHEIWLIYLFPAIGLGAISIPLLFLFAPCAGVLAFHALDFPRVRRAARTAKAGLIAAIVLGLMFAQLGLHPSYDSHFELIPQYWTAFWRYPDQVSYQEIVYGTHVQRIAAITKYENLLPDKMLVLETGRLEGNLRYYVVEYRYGVPSYDESRLNVVQSGDKVIFVTDPNDTASRREWSFRAVDVQSILNGDFSTGRLYVIDDLQEPSLTGADKLFMQALKWFR